MRNFRPQSNIVRHKAKMSNSLQTLSTIRSPFAGKPMAGVNPFALVGLQEAAERFAKENPELSVEEPEPVNFFCKNLYARWLEIPANSFVIGRIHKYEHLFMVASGVATVIDATGTHERAAPWMGVSPMGAQRIIHAVTDTIICTFHPNVNEAADMKEEMSFGNPKDFVAYAGLEGPVPEQLTLDLG